MAWTKQQFIEAAFSEIGLDGYLFDLSPEQKQRAVAKLDAMMAAWNALGIRVGYPISADPDSADISAETGVQDAANQAIYCSLAVRLAPMHGKQVSAETKSDAHRGYAALLTRAVRPIPVQMPATMPAGQGNRGYQHRGQVFLTPPSDPLAAGPDSQIDDLDV